MSAGVRWDHQKIIDANQVQQINLKNDWAPRLGVVWDPTSDHKSKVFASYGRFYEQIPMDLVIRSFSYERQPRIINYDPLSNIPDPGRGVRPWPGRRRFSAASPSRPTRTSTASTSTSTSSAESGKCAKDVAVGIKGIYRDYGNVIEDFLCINDGTYCIGNPGKGGPGQSASGFFPGFTQIYGLDYTTLFPGSASDPHLPGHPARREQTILEQLAGDGVVHLFDARR